MHIPSRTKDPNDNENSKFSYIYLRAKRVHIHLLESKTNSHLSIMGICTSHFMGTSHKRYESSNLVLLGKVSVLLRTLIFMIF
jgi:hypothetical protein